MASREYKNAVAALQRRDKCTTQTCYDVENADYLYWKTLRDEKQSKTLLQRALPVVGNVVKGLISGGPVGAVDAVVSTVTEKKNIQDLLAANSPATVFSSVLPNESSFLPGEEDLKKPAGGNDAPKGDKDAGLVWLLLLIAAFLFGKKVLK